VARAMGCCPSPTHLKTLTSSQPLTHIKTKNQEKINSVFAAFVFVTLSLQIVG